MIYMDWRNYNDEIVIKKGEIYFSDSYSGDHVAAQPGNEDDLVVNKTAAPITLNFTELGLIISRPKGYALTQVRPARVLSRLKPSIGVSREASHRFFRVLPEVKPEHMDAIKMLLEQAEATGKSGIILGKE